MDKNKFRYCILLLIDDDNQSKIFISKENKYYIRGDDKSIHVKILNEFKDIRKSYGINVIDTTDDYYKINEPNIIKHCTILLIDEEDHSKIFLSEKTHTIFVIILMIIMMLMVMIILMMIMVIIIISMMIMIMIIIIMILIIMVMMFMIMVMVVMMVMMN